MDWTPELSNLILELHTQGKNAREIGGTVSALHPVSPVAIAERINLLDNTLRNLRFTHHTMEEIATLMNLDVTTVKFRLAALGVDVIRPVPGGTEPEQDGSPEEESGWDDPLYDGDPEEKSGPVPDSIMVTLFVNKDWPLDPEYVLELVYDALADRGIDVPLEVSWTYPQEGPDE